MLSEEYAAKFFWPKIIKTESCWFWTAAKTHLGYGQFGIPTGRYCKTAYAHRIAYSLSFGEIPKGLLVLHRCDTPSCCNPDHLFVGTNADNVRDRNSKGRQNKGETVVFAKLKESEVIEIRRLYASGGVMQKQLANQFGVTTSHMSTLLSGKIWKHLL